MKTKNYYVTGEKSADLRLILLAQYITDIRPLSHWVETATHGLAAVANCEIFMNSEQKHRN